MGWKEEKTKSIPDSENDRIQRTHIKIMNELSLHPILKHQPGLRGKYTVYLSKGSSDSPTALLSLNIEINMTSNISKAEMKAIKIGMSA